MEFFQFVKMPLSLANSQEHSMAFLLMKPIISSAFLMP